MVRGQPGHHLKLDFLDKLVLFFTGRSKQGKTSSPWFGALRDLRHFRLSRLGTGDLAFRGVQTAKGKNPLGNKGFTPNP